MTNHFRSLHMPGAPLILANAWDAASARITEAAGVAAVGTTSAGIAWNLGVADGGALDRDRALAAVRRIVAAVKIGVSADLEAGYAADPDGVAETITQLVATGAVGVNLEDVWHGGRSPLRDIPDQTTRIAAARRAAGPGLFLNIRTDTYLRAVGDPQHRLAETVARAAAYLEAGADGIFVPGATDPAVIEALVNAIPGPVNVMAGPGAPSVAELAALGVARISLGSSIAAAAYAVADRAAHEVLTTGTYDSLTHGTDYGALNNLFG